MTGVEFRNGQWELTLIENPIQILHRLQVFERWDFTLETQHLVSQLVPDLASSSQDETRNAQKARRRVPAGEQNVQELIGQHLFVRRLLRQLVEKDVAVSGVVRGSLLARMSSPVVESFLGELIDESASVDCRLREISISVKEHERPESGPYSQPCLGLVKVPGECRLRITGTKRVYRLSKEELGG